MTAGELGQRLGLARPPSPTRRPLELSEEVQEYVRPGEVSLSHAKVLRRYRKPARQLSSARVCARASRSTRTRRAMREHRSRPNRRSQKFGGTSYGPDARGREAAHVKGVEEELRKKLAVKVEIRLKGKDKGQIVTASSRNDDSRPAEALRK